MDIQHNCKLVNPPTLSWDQMIARLAPPPSWDDMITGLQALPRHAAREEAATYGADVYAQAQQLVAPDAIAAARRLGLKREGFAALCRIAAQRGGVYPISGTIRARVASGRVVRVWRIRQLRRAPTPGTGRVICAFDPNAAPPGPRTAGASDVHQPAAVPDCACRSGASGPAALTQLAGGEA